MTQQEFSSRGGRARAKSQSHEALSEIAKKGAEALKKKYGPEYFKELAKKGLEARAKKKLESNISQTSP